MKGIETQAKSEITKNFLKIHIKALNSRDKVKVITAATAYSQAKRNIQPDVNDKYNALLTVLREIEQEHSISIFNDEETEFETVSYITKNLELASQLVSGVQTYTCTFKDVENANNWLAYQNDIEITDLDGDHRAFGFIIHKIHIASVKLQYRITDHYFDERYHIDEVAKTRLYASSSWDKFKQEWKNRHPNCQYVNAIRFKASGSLIGGSVGFLRFINEKFLVLYKCKG